VCSRGWCSVNTSDEGEEYMRNVVVFWLSIAAMPVITIAALPIASALESPRTVLTSKVLPCVSLARPAEDGARAF
jgi:hypothetical protein